LRIDAGAALNRLDRGGTANGGHWPRNLGVRFSLKAAVASL
jgi:hypothetical protein